MTDNRDKTLSGTPLNPKFGEGRWQDALRRMRERIAGGLELVHWDDDTLGNKDTHCAWGMCSNDVEQWPDTDDHVFPDDFKGYRRVCPREACGGCPLDERTGTRSEDLLYGCFYHCQVFQKLQGAVITDEQRATVLQLYDKHIAARETQFGRLVTADDNEPWRE